MTLLMRCWVFDMVRLMQNYFLTKDGKIYQQVNSPAWQYASDPRGGYTGKNIDTGAIEQMGGSSIILKSKNLFDVIKRRREIIDIEGGKFPNVPSGRAIKENGKVVFRTDEEIEAMKKMQTKTIVKAQEKVASGLPARIEPEPQLLTDLPFQPKTVGEKVVYGVQSALGNIINPVVEGFEGAVEATQPKREVMLSYDFLADRKYIGTETKGGVTYNVYEKLPPKVTVLSEEEQFPIIQPLIRGGVEAMQWGVVTVPATAYQLAVGEKDAMGVIDDVVTGIGVTAKRVIEKPAVGIPELAGGIIVAGKMFNVPYKALKGSKIYKVQKVKGYTTKTGTVVKGYKRVVRKEPYLVEKATQITEQEARITGVSKLGKKDAVKRMTQVVEEPDLTRVVTVRDLKTMPKSDLSMVEASGFVGGIQDVVSVQTVTRKGWKVRPPEIDPFELVTTKGKGVKIATQDVNIFTGDVLRAGYGVKRVFRPIADLDILGTAPIKVMKGRLPKSRRTPLVFEKEPVGIPDWLYKSPARGVPSESGGGLLSVVGSEVMPRTTFREVPINIRMPVFKEPRSVPVKAPSHPFEGFVASSPFDALGRMFAEQKARPMPSHPRFREVPNWVQDDVIGSVQRKTPGARSRGRGAVGTVSDDILGFRPTQTGKIGGREAPILRDVLGVMPRARQAQRMKQSQRLVERQSLALDVLGEFGYPKARGRRVPFSFPLLGEDVVKGAKVKDDFLGFQPTGYQASVTAVLLGIGSTKMPKGDALTGFELRPVIKRKGGAKRGKEKKEEKEVMRDILGF